MANNTTLQDFYQSISNNGLMVSHQFYIDLDGMLNTTDYNLFAQGAELPGRTVLQENVMLYGMTFQVPTGMAYTNSINLTLYVDSPKANYLKDVLENMMEKYGALSRNTGSKTKGAIPKTEIILSLLDPKTMDPNNSTKDYVLVGAYPTSVGNITLTHTGSTLATVPVVFSYQYYYDLAKGNAIKNLQ